MRPRTGAAATLAGLTLAAGLTAAPAQAYSPNPSASNSTYATSNCPCRNGDPFDGTYFKRDRGGKAVKTELRHKGWFVGKIEFHPYDEQVWIYDTKNDGDSFYLKLRWHDGSRWKTHRWQSPGGSATVDKKVINLSIPEGKLVNLWISDDRDGGDRITQPPSGRA